MILMRKKSEDFYDQENFKYRRLRFIVTPEEAQAVLDYLFTYYEFYPIDVKYQKRVMYEGESVEGLFLCPELGYEQQMKFDKVELELLTVLHEFAHYLHYKREKWGYNVHGKQFYETYLPWVIKAYKDNTSLSSL
jgi:hypothetical protein